MPACVLPPADDALPALPPGIDDTRLSLVADASSGYETRTRHNAASADLTLAFAVNFATAGERLTRRVAGARYAALPLALTEDPVVTARRVYRAAVLQWQARVVNVAGNGLHTLSRHGIDQAALNRWLYGVFAPVHAHAPLARLVSGGQTGVDTAGLVVALVLGIPAIGTFPSGFRRRLADGVDVTSTEAQVRAELLTQAQRLREQVTHGANFPLSQDGS